MRKKEKNKKTGRNFEFNIEKASLRIIKNERSEDFIENIKDYIYMILENMADFKELEEAI